MNDKRRVAVLGLYRSGSSAAAGALHHLGVDMGSPYFRDHYESLLLARKLRLWWREPQFREMMPREARVRRLADWIAWQEQKGTPWIGVKHPLLSARGEDLQEAWGPDVRFIWTWRPVEESIDSIKRIGWWTPEIAESLQRHLWDALQRFFADTPHLRIEFADMVANPGREIARMIEFLQIAPDAARVRTAIESVQYIKAGN
jgi:hypothetical protein